MQTTITVYLVHICIFRSCNSFACVHRNCQSYYYYLALFPFVSSAPFAGCGDIASLFHYALKDDAGVVTVCVQYCAVA